ncbi:MAG: L,D-transpeptidase family protein [Planctomycetota bacterium]|nr:L,D-transpeptidase family protein [Planctomycetota bacterium]
MALPSQLDRTTELGRAYAFRTNVKAGRSSKGLRGLVGRVPVVPTLIVGGVAAATLIAIPLFSSRGSSSDESATSNSGAGEPTSTSTSGPETGSITGLVTGSIRGSIKESDSAGPLTGPVGGANQVPAPVSITQGRGRTPMSQTPTLSEGPAPTRELAPSAPSASVPPKPVSEDLSRDGLSGLPGGRTTTSTPTGQLGPGSSGGASNGGPGGNSGNGGAGVMSDGAPERPLRPTESVPEIRSWIEAGESALARGDLLTARARLNQALLDPRTTPRDADALRDKLSAINEELVFSPRMVAGDHLVKSYRVESGDSLAKIRRSASLACDWRLIQRINRMSSPTSLRVGQTLKLLPGPFHAVVSKGAYRMDVFAGPPDSPSEWTYLRSFRVGLGTDDGTPLGTFVVRTNSKLVNPAWVNPRTAEKFGADDPKNPIGEFWIGLAGVGEAAAYAGYGIHGTIEPQSIGGQMSMGCVRMLHDDVALVYELLVENGSVVKIVP